MNEDAGEPLERAVAFDRNRMYLITLSGAADTEFFAQLLRTVRLQPEAAAVD